MMFERDNHQTRVTNSSFDNPKFSVDLHSIYLIFLFERACQDAGHGRVIFLNSYFLSGEKGWQVQSPKKPFFGVFLSYLIFIPFLCLKSKNLKKGSLMP
jgi:hypothetical protein